MLPQRARALAVASSAALALGLVACDASVEVDLAPAESTSPPTPSPSASRSPSPADGPSTAPSAPPPSPSAAGSTDAGSSATAAPRPRRLPDRLLTGEEMPGFNTGFAWKVRRTRTAEGDPPFGTCQRFALTTIGAMRVVVREYTPTVASPGSSAGHLVAEFADRATARRAYEVLRSWRGQCDEQLQQYDRRQVGALEPVTVPVGEGGWYLLVYGPPPGASADEAYFDAQGMALVGSRITLLEMRLVGQDYDYRAGREPMVEAVRTAVGKLG